MKKLYYIFITWILLTSSLFTQSYSFDSISEKDGLSDNKVLDIFQDNDGFLWFITPDGVNIYDGYNFTILRNDPFNKNSISPGIPITITEDTKNNIWIGTTRGLNKYDKLTNSFKYYSTESGLSFHQITKLFTDNEGILWVGMGDVIGRKGDGGLAYFDSEKNHFTSFVNDTLDDNSLSNNFVTSIAEDDQNNLWIGTSNGLNYYNKLNRSFRNFFIDGSNKRERANYINDLFIDSKNNLWIAAEHGLYKFDWNYESFEKINYHQEKSASVSRVVSLYESHSDPGVLWVGTNGGLFEYEIKTGLSKHYQREKDNSETLPSNQIRRILEDHSGILWFATGNSGLAKLNRFKPNLKVINSDLPKTFSSENNVFSIITNSSGNLLIGSNEDVIEINSKTGTKNTFINDLQVKSLLKHTRVVSITEDSQNRFWLGTSSNGILVVDSDTLVSHLSLVNRSSKQNLQSERISFVMMVDSNYALVGSKGGGLDKVDIKSFDIYPYSFNDSIQTDRVNVLSYFTDDNNTMWIGTTRGIKKLDLITNEFIQFDHEEEFKKYIGDDMIINFMKSKSEDDILWLGTFNRGLCRLNLVTGEFKRITMQNSSLPSNAIHSMLGYGSNTIWISTNNGLVRFDTKTEEMRAYSSHDGFKIYQFNINSNLIDKNGNFYFGGNDGIVKFDPSAVRKNHFLPRLVINDFQINGKSIIREGNKSFVQHLIDEKEISLSHDQNSISIDFVALHFASPSNNQYEYQLINYDEESIRTNEIRRVSYINLTPGDYSFILKASNADGIKAANEIEFNISINPPLYRTWWAYSIYFLLIIGFLQLYRKYEINKQIEAAKLKESEMRAKQAELKAEAAAANVKIVQIENERKTKELEDARRLQLSMLPDSIPTSDKYEITVYMKTASEVGGDYYDFTISEDGTLNIGFGDATGHGMQAGVVVSLIKGLFVSDSAENDLSTFMLKSNNTIKRSRLGRIMMAFSLLKLKDNVAQFSSAGMPPILIHSEASKHVEELNLMGMPLGAMLDFPYREFQFEVHPGDTILFMSDGLPELTNSEGEQFAYFRVSKLFKDIAAMSPNEIISEIIKTSDDWLGGKPIEDDITLLVLKIK
ncbi:MAG: two-component regulator propeller domain-containing protein [Bacteroidota bacterium]